MKRGLSESIESSLALSSIENLTFSMIIYFYDDYFDPRSVNPSFGRKCFITKRSSSGLRQVTATFPIHCPQYMSQFLIKGTDHIQFDMAPIGDAQFTVLETIVLDKNQFNQEEMKKYQYLQLVENGRTEKIVSRCLETQMLEFESDTKGPDAQVTFVQRGSNYLIKEITIQLDDEFCDTWLQRFRLYKDQLSHAGEKDFIHERLAETKIGNYRKE